MRKFTLLILCFNLLMSCQTSEKRNSVTEEIPEFNEQMALELYHFAFDCIDQEYPNKMGHVMSDAESVVTPQSAHPAFYGCFDWHSAVHGHWTLVTLLHRFPAFKHHDEILQKLQNHLTEENIQKELSYFYDKNNASFERTYGWAWLLKLDQALQDLGSPEAIAMHENLDPLVQHIANKYIDFLYKLSYPIRVGEHSNTAFGMSLAFDYASSYNQKLATAIIEQGNVFYGNDVMYSTKWEPSGFDFLSPSLQEISLMQKIMPFDEFQVWVEGFIPGFEERPSEFFEIAKTNDRSDGKMAHLDGLNFSRAWCLYELGFTLGNVEMIDLATTHFDFSYKTMDKGEYAGSHWLATFAVLALTKAEEGMSKTL